MTPDTAATTRSKHTHGIETNTTERSPGNLHCPKAVLVGDINSTQTFSFETVPVLLAVLLEKGESLEMKDYQLMADLDGARSASSFDHGFCKVKARARELTGQAGGENGATPAKKTGGGAKVRTPGSAGGKRKKKADVTPEAGEDGSEESPSKKVKPEPGEDNADAFADDGDAFAD